MKKEQQQLMILKVKETKTSRFKEKSSARLFNNKEMQKFVELVSAYVNCGCDVKVEYKEMEM